MRPGLVIAAAACLIAAVIVSPRPASADEPRPKPALYSDEDLPLLQEIFSVWQARAARVQNFRAEWRHVTLPTKPAEIADDVVLPPAEPFPTERLVFSMDSSRVAFRRYPLSPIVDSEDLAPSITTFDGVNRHSLVRSYTDMMPTTIQMSPGTWREAVNNSEYFPFIATFRLLNVQDGWGLGDCPCVIEERETVHEGQPCTVLRFERGWRATFFAWVSRDPDRRILRGMSKGVAHNGRPITYWDIDLMDYRPDPVAGLIPCRWRKFIADFTRPNHPHHEAVLQRFDANVDFPQSEFTAEPFPVGAVVNDGRDVAKGTQRSQVLGNGRLRALPRTQHAGAPPTKSAPVMSESGATIAFGLLLVMVAAGFIWRAIG